MTTRTITAMFTSRADADSAAQRLINDLKVDRGAIRLSPEAGMTDTGYSQAQPYQETGFFASLKNLFLPDEDRYSYAEGMRRGHVLLSAAVNDAEVERAADILEHAGAMDLDQEEATWRKGGWSGYDATRHGSAGPATAAAGMAAGSATGAARAGAGNAATSASTPSMGAQSGTMATGNAATGRTASARDDMGRDEVIPVVEERVVVGKREVDRGRVRVRSYVVERPVEEQVRLHEERVQVDRRPVDRPLTEADRAAAFQERVVEARATGEEAVVSKEARVVEEIGVHKEATDRTETVRDTVRRTEVEVDDGRGGTRAGAAGTGTTADTGRGAATGAGAAVDRTLGTNMTGTNPAAHAPDGTPGNPPGTAASRAVDKTLGTNISGANPTPKS